jgi:ribosomal protein L32
MQGLTLTTSTFRTSCSQCGKKILPGDACYQGDNGKYCFCILPERRLIPKKEYEKKQALHE